MFKKVFASILSMFMVLTLLVPAGSFIQVKASDIEPFAAVQTIPYSTTKTKYFSATCNSTTANVPVVITLNYYKQISSSGTTYSNFTAELNETASKNGAFYARLLDTPTITKYIADKTVYVTGRVKIIYNYGSDYKNVTCLTTTYSIEYTLQ